MNMVNYSYSWSYHTVLVFISDLFETLCICSSRRFMLISLKPTCFFQFCRNSCYRMYMHKQRFEIFFPIFANNCNGHMSSLNFFQVFETVEIGHCFSHRPHITSVTLSKCVTRLFLFAVTSCVFLDSSSTFTRYDLSIYRQSKFYQLWA